MPPKKLKETYLQIKERNARELKNRTTAKLLAIHNEASKNVQREHDEDVKCSQHGDAIHKNGRPWCLYVLCGAITLLLINLILHLQFLDIATQR